MSLHGEIKVNGETIATWSARRLTKGLTHGPDGTYPYECWLAWTDGRVGLNGKVITHRRGDGAAELVRKVMEVAAEIEEVNRAG